VRLITVVEPLAISEASPNFPSIDSGCCRAEAGNQRPADFVIIRSKRMDHSRMYKNDGLVHMKRLLVRERECVMKRQSPGGRGYR